MGLFDKIKDNAKNISMRAIEATREYDDEYQSGQQTPAPDEAVDATTIQQAPLLTEAQSSQLIEQQPSESPQPTPIDIDELVFIDEPTSPEIKPDKSTEAPSKKSTSRTSKVIELTKEEHEKAEKERRQEKTKQAAKERLAKSYVPSYKKPVAKKDEKANDSKKAKVEVKKPKEPARPPASGKTFGIVDIAPGKFVDPTKKAIYARERAALSALASQRKLNGTVPLYTANHMNFRTRVFINRIEYSGSFGKNVIPIEQVAWVKLRHGGTGVIIETNESKRVVMVVKQSDRLPFADAILRVQALQPKKSKFRDTKTVRIDELEKFSEGIDELEKLSKLFDKGILSQEEFDLKKKQILGI